MRIGVVIRDKHDNWSITRFADEEVLQTFVELVEQELGDQIIDINLVQLDPSSPCYPPDDYTPSLANLRVSHEYWCPWCGEFRVFAPTAEYPNDVFCTICHISDSDYWVRRFNKLDFLEDINPDKKKRKMKRTRKSNNGKE